MEEWENGGTESAGFLLPLSHSPILRRFLLPLSDSPILPFLEMPSSINAQVKLFDSCADVYARYRPSYPEATLATLVAELQLTPPDFVRALKANKAAQAAWEKLGYTHRKEYVEAIEEAKKPETRARRIEKAIAQLAAGIRP